MAADGEELVDLSHSQGQSRRFCHVHDMSGYRVFPEMLVCC